MIKRIKDQRVSVRICGDYKERIIKKYGSMQKYFDKCNEREFKKKVKK